MSYHSSTPHMIDTTSQRVRIVSRYRSETIRMSCETTLSHARPSIDVFEPSRGSETACRPRARERNVFVGSV